MEIRNIALPKTLNCELNKFTKRNISKLMQQKTKTGFPQLDDILGGGLSPGLTVLGAVTGLGKSTLMLQIAEHIALNKTPVIFFSLEMPRVMIAAKAISRQLFINAGMYERFALSATELVFQNSMLDAKLWESISGARKAVGRTGENLIIEDSTFQEGSTELSAKRIYDIVSNYIKESNKLPVVVVDYLQILPTDGTNTYGSDKQNVDLSVKWMSKLAHERNIPVVLISSLSRASYDQKVQIDSFKETGGIEYTADVVLGLSFSAAPDIASRKSTFNMSKEKEKSPRFVEINILKQRYGSSGAGSTVKLEYYAKYDYFKEIELPQAPQKKAISDKMKSERADFDKAKLGDLL